MGSFESGNSLDCYLSNYINYPNITASKSSCVSNGTVTLDAVQCRVVSALLILWGTYE